MLKKELLKLIEALKDDDNIDETLSKSEVVKALANSGLTIDAFKDKIAHDKDFMAFLDSEKDKHSNKALETWKTNNLQKLIDEAVSKANPQETPEQKRIRELEEKIAKADKDRLREQLTNGALKFATEKKLPVELIDFVVGADEDSTNVNLTKLAEVFSKHDENIKTALLKEKGYTPPDGGGGGGDNTTLAGALKAHYNN
ncbi:MAG: DUF4355 domain-containing protein [Solirubrobacterales bacterium]